MNNQSKYQWIIFDADETLFHFPSYQGLQTLLAAHQIDFTESDYAEFQQINQPLWSRYQNNEISLAQLAAIRFAKLAAQTQQPATALNHALQMHVATLSQPLAGARDTLATLQQRGIKMGIITNGFEALQQPRLQCTDFKKFFEFCLSSETAGAAKPNRAIFNQALEIMQQPNPQNILMVGDSLTSDMLGAFRAGWDTCWLNPNQQPNSQNIKINYQIKILNELTQIIQAA